MADSATLVSSLSRFTYDVFLSFRGEDTRHGFTSHLWKALSDRGICTFFDDAELKKGDEITPSLVKAINESRAAVVVFSQNYAASRFCLDELVCILESSRANGRLVLPVFYDVDPSHVRHQKGSYGEALAVHEKNFNSDMERIQKWKRALFEAANLVGWHFEHGHRYEYEFIEDIVKEVSSKLHSATLMAADHLVGLEHRVMDLEWLADDKSRDKYRMIGIWGMGGVGKTTLARALYDYISLQFEASCFLHGVRETSMKSGLVHLQEILLAETLGEKDLWLASVSEGTQLLKHRLNRKKVLLVLDDVDSLDQLQALAGGTDWFSPGSRVIITTRDVHVLKSYGVNIIYEVEGLTDDEAFELLCWKAFKTDRVRPVYVDMLYRAKAYASGIPLALEVIGSYLYGKGIEEWKSTLHSYEQIPNTDDIQMILRLSYDALGEQEKQIFLDIACFFNGCKLAEVEYILSAHHGYCLTPHIRALVQKSLVKINERGRVTMHDLLQELGREIVRWESPEHPGKRSRLWSREDIIQVLKDNAGTSEIQIIILDSPKSEGVVQWDGKAFMKMKDLRTLIIRNERFSEGPKILPNSLRVLEWWEYPLQSLPSDFYPEKLAILKFPCGDLSPKLSKFEKFLNMRLLNLDGCKSITHIPDISGAPNLEELTVVYCENIVEIHESVGFMNKLRIMDVEGCRRLQSFPPIHLTSLQYLNLSRCSSLESFPEILENMENITHLSLEYTAIKELPYSIGNLIRLQSLELHGCGKFQLPSSIVLLAELERLSISQCERLQFSKQDEGTEKVSSKVSSKVKHIDFLSCNISDEFIQIGLTWFANVKELDLSMNNFTILPACIQECHLLTKLNLDYCVNLEKSGGIPPNLETLSAVRCTSLKDLDFTVLASTKKFCFLRELILDDCDNLQEIRGIPPSIELLSARNCRSLTASCRRMLLNQELHEAGNKRFCLPGSQMPEWFEHCSQGHSISFWFRNKFPAISLCLFGPMHKLPLKFRPIVIINGSISKTDFQTEKGFCFEFSSLTDHIHIFGERQIKLEDNVDEVPSENEWNHAVVSVDIDLNWNPTEPFVVRTGLHVIEQESSMDNIRFTNPYDRPFLKEKHVLGDMEFSRSLFVQLQKRAASLDF